MVAELIQQYEDKLPSDLLAEGMRIAVKQNARKIQYIEKIWQNWIKDDIKSMADYQRHEAEWENKRASNGSQPSDPSRREYTDAEAKVAAGYIMRSLEEFLKEGCKTKDDIQQYIDSDRFAYDPPLKTMALELLRSEGVVA
jgi:DnaD/phage-associated family protein